MGVSGFLEYTRIRRVESKNKALEQEGEKHSIQLAEQKKTRMMKIAAILELPFFV